MLRLKPQYDRTGHASGGRVPPAEPVKEPNPLPPFPAREWGTPLPESGRGRERGFKWLSTQAEQHSEGRGTPAEPVKEPNPLPPFPAREWGTPLPESGRGRERGFKWLNGSPCTEPIPSFLPTAPRGKGCVARSGGSRWASSRDRGGSRTRARCPRPARRLRPDRT